jgi:menaquinone-dependent protoporphyrinogen oxidase
MKVLVSAASKHGATGEIAAAIGEVLLENGLEVDVLHPDAVDAVTPYDTVILGSAVYAGRWLESAKTLIHREREALRSRRVWLFSSGPIGDPLLPAGEPPEGAALRETLQAVEHRVFAGRIERSRLGLGEKALMNVMHAPDGDFRNWSEVRAWASGIAGVLQGNRLPRPTELSEVAR